MKIAHIITKLELGGAQLNTLATCEHLQTNGHAVKLISGEGGYFDRAGRPPFGHQVIPGLENDSGLWKTFWAFLSLWHFLRWSSPDIVHTHSTKAGILGRLAAGWVRLVDRDGKPRIIHTVHGWGHHGLTGWRRSLLIWLEQQLARITDKLIFVSRADMALAADLRICTTTGELGQGQLIRSGVDRSRYKPLPLEQREKLVVTVGNMKPQKDYPAFKAFAEELSKLVPDVQIHHYGGWMIGPDGPVCRMGESYDLATILPRARVFVLTSRWEGLPRSLLEALCSGTPAVCFDAGGIREVLENEAGVILHRHNSNTSTMAHVVSNLLLDDSLWRDLSIGAAQVVGSEFDIKTMLERLDYLYYQLLTTRC